MGYFWAKDEGNQFFKHVPHTCYSTRASGTFSLTLYRKSRTFSRNNGPELRRQLNGHEYRGNDPGYVQTMNNPNNEAYKRNNEAILTIQILHEKIYPATAWFPKSRETFASLLVIITSKTIH